VTERLSVRLLPAASCAVTLSTLMPDSKTIPMTDQLVVGPLAVPLPPRLLLHVISVTPTLSDAVPPMVRGLVVVVSVGFEVGVLIVTVGRLVSAPAAIPDQPNRMRLAAISAVARDCFRATSRVINNPELTPPYSSSKHIPYLYQQSTGRTPSERKSALRQTTEHF
jgi:hypothetical protein